MDSEKPFAFYVGFILNIMYLLNVNFMVIKILLLMLKIIFTIEQETRAEAELVSDTEDEPFDCSPSPNKVPSFSLRPTWFTWFMSNCFLHERGSRSVIHFKMLLSTPSNVRLEVF